MIYVECNTDRILIYVLTNKTPNAVEHCAGKGGVLEKLEYFRSSIGVIDEDPEAQQDSRIRNFNFTGSKFSLEIYENKDKNNKLIVLCPRLEDWILEIVKEEDINLNNFGFSEDPNKFHKQANLNLAKFQALLHTLIKTNNEKLIFLRDFILGKN
jgi:hypothetical protein